MHALDKQEILRLLANNLSIFRPDLKDQFMCPICLKTISIASEQKIDKAHIFPKKAGGTLTTWLCQTCNHKSGRLQDKWFGELLRLVQEQLGLRPPRFRKKRIILDGRRLDVQWQQKAGGGAVIQFGSHFNRPDNFFSVVQATDVGSKINVTHVPNWAPIMENVWLVKVGALTSAYLLWFSIFGYSWVLQSHLDPVREQIKNPEKSILPDNFCRFTDPMVPPKFELGIIRVGHDMGLFMTYFIVLAILPGENCPDIYSKLATIDKARPVRRDLIVLKGLSDNVLYERPASLKVGQNHLIRPDGWETVNQDGSGVVLMPPSTVS